MKLKKVHIRNFRRLENVSFHLDCRETLFVGPNNSGKTSATSVFRCFLGRRSFTIHDFPLKTLEAIDEWHPEKKDESDEVIDLPEIGFDLWFSLDPEDPESAPYAKIGVLITSLVDNIVEVGVGCVFKANDPVALWRDYGKLYPEDEAGKRKKTVSQYLESEGQLKKHFGVFYSSLNQADDGLQRVDLTPKEGKQTLQSLLRVDFVDAQRNLQDDEMTSRGSRLSAAFSSFYRANLEQAKADEDVIKIVEEHNQKLTDHYDVSFKDLMNVLKKLGVPSASERELTIVSALGAQEALKGTTDLVYTEAGATHSLPEAYNGLGFKNLVLMAIQLRDFQMQWTMTEEHQPLCHVIFIEEPEVHLHVQIQQTFIGNMWSILDELAKNNNKGQITPQLVVTTHSSHILNSVDFEKVRYFRRCRREGEAELVNTILPISEVHSLKDFSAPVVTEEPNPLSEGEALAFLKRYMTLTHCDLMFADAAVLIEGAAERLLFPDMIDKAESKLSGVYLTILEVGGAYAHIFSALLKFLHVPYLVITDLDSVKTNPETNKKKACCANDLDAETSNAALKSYFPEANDVLALTALSADERTQEGGDRFVTFQRPINVPYGNQNLKLYARTFEEALIFENLSACVKKGFLSTITLPETPDHINMSVFEQVRASTFKKTDFALGILAASVDWTPPEYICEGLNWLAKRLKIPVDAGETNGT